MVDQCSTCRFGRIAPVSAGPHAGVRHCHCSNPTQKPQGEAFPWIPVADDYWCGQGIHNNTGIAFSSAPTSPITSPAWTVSDQPPSGGSDGNFWMVTPADTTPASIITVYVNIGGGVWKKTGQWTSA